MSTNDIKINCLHESLQLYQLKYSTSMAAPLHENILTSLAQIVKIEENSLKTL